MLVPDFSKFDWEDPLSLNKVLSDEEQAISETARSFCQEHLKPKVIEMSRKECEFRFVNLLNMFDD